MPDASFMFSLSILSGRLRGILLSTLAGLSAAGVAWPVSAQEMPAVVHQLQLSDVRFLPEAHKHHGRIVEGRLPDGSVIEIDLDRRDQIQEIQSHHRHAFALEAVEQVLPEAVRAAEGYPVSAHLWRLELHDGHSVEMEGYDAHHRTFKAKFSRSGHLLDMKFD